MKEYWQKKDETKNALKEGWLYTGDIAKMDCSGYFEIVGRKKDLIIVQKTEYLTGHNVYPNEVEDVLLLHPKVKEAGVIGLPNEASGELVKAFVVLEEEAEVTTKELIDFCEEKLVEYKVPQEIEFKKELPKNFLGKILRKELREMEGVEQ